MNIKIELEIVTGFIGSGKTLFINELLNKTLVTGERVLIIQCEDGEKRIKVPDRKKSKVIIKEYNPSKALTEACLKQMINFYNPHRVIIELNGMRRLEETLMLLEGELNESFLEPIIYYIADAASFEIFYSNMTELIAPFIIHSSLIIINNCGIIDFKKKKNIIAQIEALNNNAFIIQIDDISKLGEALLDKDLLSRGLVKKILIKLKNSILRWNTV
ncbi:hypothetical protein M2651_10045 [Clostridium sp. SYSU_GA19001]|uniref:GTP-binding protein n=1 Tax=Clostridium caldaquaticum TaxID=2940653 RepID=UPI002077739E|nr:GTP-binding protein [Clostridium caldaquaticum]MCM8711365.1 hypothetical protein [Clostridium caldaquaticum]